MHPDVIEAAKIQFSELSEDTEKKRARRVIAAQAKPEAIPDGAVHAAVIELGASEAEVHEAMRAALSAALEYMAKEGSDDPHK